MRWLAILPLLGALALTGCGGEPAPAAQQSGAPSISPSAPPHEASQPRIRLAARAAAAKDLRQTAFYVLKTTGRPDRTISFTRAVDGTWRVDVPGGAHSGSVDIALVFAGGALHQCVLPTNGCVRVEGKLAADADPKLQHLITDWLTLFTDSHQALAVSVAVALQGSSGECYAIESSAVSLQLPLDAGIYCFERDGTLTAAKLSVGTMVLSGKPGAGPPTLALPGPVMAGAPLKLVAPPQPSVTATPKP